MPSKFDKVAISDAFFKRSAKLLPCQKEMIVFWSNRGLSQRKIAAMFSVSRRTVIFIVDPAKRLQNLECRRARGQEQYYKKDKHTAAIREHRQYKKELFGKIK